MKRLFVILLALSLFCALILCAGAAYEPDRLVDEADLLTNSEKAKVIARLDAIAQAQDFDVVIHTTTDIGRQDILDYGEDFYLEHGYGEDGIILVRLAGEEPEWGYVVFGKGERVFDDAAMDELDAAFLADLRAGNYLKAFLAFADTAEELVGDYSPISVGTILISLVVGILLAWLIPMSVLKGQLKSVRTQAAASGYARPGSMQLTQQRDIFLYRNIIRTAKPKNNSSSGQVTSGGRSGRSGRG